MFEEIKEELTNICRENKYIKPEIFHDKTKDLSSEEKNILIDLFSTSIRKEIPNTINNKTHKSSNKDIQYAREEIIKKLKDLGFKPIETKSNDIGNHILCITDNKDIKIKIATKKDDSFMLEEKNEKINAEDIYYIFARFIDETNIKFYIYESAEVAKKIADRHIEYNSHLKRNGLPRDNNSMRELSIDDSHLEKWEMLTK